MHPDVSGVGESDFELERHKGANIEYAEVLPAYNPDG